MKVWSNFVNKEFDMQAAVLPTMGSVIQRDETF